MAYISILQPILRGEILPEATLVVSTAYYRCSHPTECAMWPGSKRNGVNDLTSQFPEYSLAPRKCSLAPRKHFLSPWTHFLTHRKQSTTRRK